jgi:hypothetical protein
LCGGKVGTVVDVGDEDVVYSIAANGVDFIGNYLRLKSEVKLFLSACVNKLFAFGGNVNLCKVGLCREANVAVLGE